MDECCRRGHGSNLWVGAVDSLLSMLKFDSLNLFQPRHGYGLTAQDPMHLFKYTGSVPDAASKIQSEFSGH